MTFQLGEWLPCLVFVMAAWAASFLLFWRESRRGDELLEEIYGDKLDQPIDRDCETPRDVAWELLQHLMRNPALRAHARRQEIYLHLHVILLEELIYRAPLLILFSGLTTLSGIGIILSTGLFGWSHFRGSLGLMRYKAVQNIWNPSVPLRIRIMSVLGPSVLGFCASVLAVGFQSLLLPILLHIAWNTTTNAIIPIIATRRAVAAHKRAMFLEPSGPH